MISGKSLAWAGTLLMVGAGTAFAQADAAQSPRKLSLDEFRDRMKAAWVGQMAGVGWGAPTEFRFEGRTIPDKSVPAWTPETVNQYEQDDLYVEMTFVRSLEEYGPEVPIRQAGIDFANSGYDLWHANKYGRKNLRDGIAPPDSGHPKFNHHADDIDYQIEADYSGIIAPGLPNVPIELGEKFGRLMNYGDGLYGGQFVGGMYAEAYFEKDVEKIVEAGLRCIPEGSQYHECISDVLRWHRETPENWHAAWQKIEDKYDKNRKYRRFSCSKPEDPFNIDAKLNGAYIVMGLLYGEGDIEKTAKIAMQCGQDSDCNPSSATGILFTTIGFAKVPETYTKALDNSKVFSHTQYSFPKLLEVSEALARQWVVRAGGAIEKDAQGKETFVLPVQTPRPSALEQCWSPAPPAESRFTPEEMEKIQPKKKD